MRLARTMADAAWRLALLAALVWIGLELHGLRADLQPVDDTELRADARTEDEQDSLDAMHDELLEIKEKVNAIMLVMARAK